VTSPHLEMIEALARRRGVRLAPDWAAGVPADLDFRDPAAIGGLTDALGWPSARRVRARPRANAFPLLIFTSGSGWALAEQWETKGTIRALALDGIEEVVWSRECLLYELNFPALAEKQNLSSARGIFWSAIMRRKHVLVEAAVATVVINILALATSLYSMQVYDRVIPRGGFATLWVLTVGIGFALLVDLVMRVTRALMVNREAMAIDAEVSEYFFDRMQAVRLDARPPGVGTMAAQLRGLEQVRQLFSSASIFVMADLPFALLFLVVMGAIGGVVAIVPLVVFALSSLLAVLFSRGIREYADRAQVSGNRKNGLLVEALDASETIKANRGGWHMLAAWNDLIDAVHRHDLQVQRWSAIASQTFMFLQQISYVGIVVWGAYRVNAGDMTMGGLIACTLISGRINGPLVASLPGFVVQWGYARSSLQALDRLLSMPSDQPLDRQKIRLDTVKARLEVEDAIFAQVDSRFALTVPKLVIGPGERVGIIGSVGAGKSTLLRLLAGMMPPQKGHVLLDGIALDQLAEDDLRREVCYFPQDYRLVSGTLRDNLTLGLPACPDDVLLEAASRTGLDDLIKTHPKALDLPIFEGGGGLSGAQRTMVGLARVFLLRPRLLLLDEPTSNLDQENEARVFDFLTKESGPDMSVIIVTHKLRFLGAVSRLLVVQGGRIVLDGPRASVIEQLRRSQIKNASAAPSAAAVN
jgi:ATP-binding cassette subfamily C protein LapB